MSRQYNLKRNSGCEHVHFKLGKTRGALISFVTDEFYFTVLYSDPVDFIQFLIDLWLKEMSQGSKSHSAPSIPKYLNYFPYFHEWNCNVMNTMVGHVIAEFYYYNQWKPSIPSTLGAIWGHWNSMDLSMECLEFLNS
jgi:hypothetical protein